MRKTIVMSCFFAVGLLLFLTCSSAIGVQTQKNVFRQQSSFQSFEKTILQDVIEEKSSSSIMKMLFSTHSVTEKLNTVLDQFESSDQRVISLVDKCSQFHQMIGTLPESGRLLTVLFFTILTEFMVYLMTLQAPAIVLLFLSIVINGITNPAVNIVYYTVYDNVLVLETIVVLVETVMLAILLNTMGISSGIGKAFVLSLLANVASYLIATGITKRIYDAAPVET